MSEERKLDTAINIDDISPQVISCQKLEKVLKFFNNIDVNCTLFVIPANAGLPSWKENYIETIRGALDSGHEIALHGYRHIKNEFGYIFPFPFPGYSQQRRLLERGRDCLKGLIGREPVGFRAPSYRFNNSTFKALSHLRFLYDSSKTVFKPTNNIRFRMKTFNAPKVSSNQGLLEIPVTADYTYKLKGPELTEALEKALNDFEWTKHQNGVFVLNNHVQCLTETGFAFLDKLVRRLSGKTDFVRLADLVS